jgi:hypothetical protein
MAIINNSDDKHMADDEFLMISLYQKIMYINSR